MPTFIFRDTSTGVATELFGDVPFDVGSLLPEGTYQVQALSDVAPVTITIAPSGTVVPSQVGGLSVVPGEYQNSLSWTAPENGGSAITDYVLEVDSGAGFTTITDGVSVSTGFIHTGLTSGVSYTYRVAAANSAGVGSFSSVVSGVPTGAAVPAEAEADAQGHWFFGSDNATEADMITGQPLVQNGAAPTRSDGYLRIEGQGNGLLSHVADNADITFCAVVRRPAGTTGAILGGVMDSADGPQEGWSPFTWGDNELRVRNKGGSDIIDLDLNAPVGSFYFIAISLSAAGEYVYFRGTQGANIVSSDNAGRGTVRSLDVSLGDVHFDSPSLEGALDCAEMILWQSAKTTAEIEAIFLRSRDRLAARGITLLAP